MNADARTVWDTYTESWRAPTAAEKRDLWQRCLSPACVYTDPLAVARGWGELTDYMLDFHRQVPGGHFVTEEFMAHHRRSVARWRMVGRDGTTIGTGMSYGEYDDDGKLVVMTGFFLPPGGA
jgi:SnoaL-like domain